MFRELIRKKQALSMEMCLHILKTEKRGVLSVNGAGGYPYGMPMNHWYNEADDTAYIEKEIAQHGHRTLLLVLTPAHICGKRVEEA